MEDGKDCPKLRNIDIFPAEVSGQRVICLRDPLNLSGKVLFVPVPDLFFDQPSGRAAFHPDIQSEFMRRSANCFTARKFRK